MTAKRVITDGTLRQILADPQYYDAFTVAAAEELTALRKEKAEAELRKQQEQEQQYGSERW